MFKMEFVLILLGGKEIKQKAKMETRINTSNMFFSWEDLKMFYERKALSGIVIFESIFSCFWSQTSYATKTLPAALSLCNFLRLKKPVGSSSKKPR